MILRCQTARRTNRSAAKAQRLHGHTRYIVITLIVYSQKKGQSQPRRGVGSRLLEHPTSCRFCTFRYTLGKNQTGGRSKPQQTRNRHIFFCNCPVVPERSPFFVDASGVGLMIGCFSSPFPDASANDNRPLLRSPSCSLPSSLAAICVLFPIKNFGVRVVSFVISVRACARTLVV